jgi:hypothetical protein
MMEAGHSFAHKPQPIHLLASTCANIPRLMVIAFLGHTLIQAPQATQSLWDISARLFAIFLVLLAISI